MTATLIYVVSCEMLGLAIPFVGTCWGHVMSKCCQHDTNDLKFVLAELLFPSKKHKPICKKLPHEPKKVGRGGKNGTRQVWLLE